MRRWKTKKKQNKTKKRFHTLVDGMIDEPADVNNNSIEANESEERLYLIFDMAIENENTRTRYMVAARNLRAGDVVFRERAVVSGPKMGAAPLCLGCCGRVDGGSPRCPRCSYPFCAASCYQSAAHAGECAVLSRSKFRVKIADYEAAHGAYDCVTPLRCLLAREADPDGYRVSKRKNPPLPPCRPIAANHRRSQPATDESGAAKGLGVAA